MQTNISAKGKYKEPLTVRVAMWSARHRWIVVGLWTLVTVGLLVTSIVMGGTKTSDASGNPGGGSNKLESYKAWQVYNEGVKLNLGEASQDIYIVISSTTLKTSDAEFKSTVENTVATLSGLTAKIGEQTKLAVSKVTNPFLVPPTAGLISPDNSTVRIVGAITGEKAEREKKLDVIKPALTNLRSQNKNLEITAFNNSWLNDDINKIVTEDLDGSLKITLPLTFIILLIAFGAVAAAIVPLILAITALLGAFGLMGIYSQLVNPISSYATQLIVLIGLAVAVDYSLFMVTRFKAERRRGRAKMMAIEISSSTAGRAVFFSGITVAISVAGLFFLEDQLFRSMALGTIGVVVLSIVGSLTFLPATLSILGDKINWGRIPYFGRERDEGGGFWSGIVKTVMRHPIVLASIVVILLLSMAYPLLHLRMGIVGIDSFPDKLEGVRTLNLMNEKWPQGTTLKMYVMATNSDKPETMAALEKLRVEGLKVKGLYEPTGIQTSANGKVSYVSFTMGGSENDQANQDLVKKLRTEVVPPVFKGLNGVDTYVAGDTAEVVDIVKNYTDAMPLVFGFVLGLSFLLLLVAFHSIVIPIKAIILNLLSTGAAYGALVLVFQDGWFGEQLGIKSTGVIESWIPVFIFTILFGLSMDYHLFILTRIKETKDKGATSNEAVAKGISVTSGVITSAAAIMVMVFAVFVTMQLVIIRQLGLGLAVAVFIDATIIRSILLPATMRLLGDWNWFMPKFLDWIPHITIEGEPEEENESESDKEAALTSTK